MRIFQNKMMRWFIASLFLLGIVTCCILGLKMIQKPNTVTLNGQQVKGAGIRMVNGQLHMTPSFIEQELGMRIQLTEKQETGERKSYYSNQVAVLMYHQLADDSKMPHILSVAAFQKQMELLKTNDFHVISMEEYVNFMQKCASIPDNAVLLTFDDGYESFYTKVFPILQEYGYTATNFVIVSSIDNKAGRPKITWDQMRKMKEHGMSFFSHTYDSHRYGKINAEGKKKPMLSRHLYIEDKQRVESDDEYLQRIEGDLSKAEQRLKEELGNTYGIVAFPFGAHNKDVLKVLNKLGIGLSFTVKKGMTKRTDSNAYRFDAGSRKQSLEHLIQLLKETSQVGKGGKEFEVLVDGKKIPLSKVRMDASGKVMIPLSEFCMVNSIQVDWNKDRSQLHLTRE